ncbi:hypothetical protein JQC92_07685 [Shewanella sp. 202IG2-18]|uniref:WD40/YVTN/BNR-like repeat-containing protein n=1 Tax=Parashewanella hymeniacidonis TaxID=2807618 RepID=UPI0019617C16|nr:YCF48-related protein [Parashewanella hymeniacidonis]MBM7071917.1 hypothetical protein [Parashewanella hymeniacidonis]
MNNNDFLKKVGFGLSFCFLLTSTLSIATPQIQPKALSSLVTDIDRNVAVGERGHIFIYENGWKQVQSPVSVNLTNSTMLNAQIGWAVGHDATIIKTTDGGMTWLTQSESQSIEKPFLDVTFFDKKHGIAVGAYGLFYRTKDGGKNWREEFHLELLHPDDQAYLEELKDVDPEGYEIEKGSLLPHFNKILLLNDGRLLLVGELGMIAVSDDFGHSFQQIDFPYEGSMFSVIETSDHIYVAGLRGNLFKTDKTFSTWKKVTLPNDSTIHSILKKDNGLLLVGNSGVIYSVAFDDDVKLLKQIKGVNLLSVSELDGNIWLAGTNGLTVLEK